VNKLAWISSLLLSLCGLPEAYRALTAENYSISLVFVFMWFAGEFGLLVNSLVRLRDERYLIMNYVMNLIFISIILWRIYG
jgi:hypothetical protein